MTPRRRNRDKLAADLLTVAGGVASVVATVLGRADAGAALRDIVSAAADAIRRRGESTDRIVHRLRHVEQVDMPWSQEGKK